MSPRLAGSALALLAAVLVGVSIVTSALWAGPPEINGQAMHRKEVFVGLTGAKGCNTGGDGSCAALDMKTAFTVTGYIGTAVTILLVAGLIVLALLVLQTSEHRKRAAKLVLIATAAVAGVALALLVQGPTIVSGRVTIDHVPIGHGMYLLWGGLVLAAASSAVAKLPIPAPAPRAPALPRAAALQPPGQPPGDVLAMLHEPAPAPAPAPAPPTPHAAAPVPPPAFAPPPAPPPPPPPSPTTGAGPLSAQAPFPAPPPPPPPAPPPGPTGPTSGPPPPPMASMLAVPPSLGGDLPGPAGPLAAPRPSAPPALFAAAPQLRALHGTPPAAGPEPGAAAATPPVPATRSAPVARSKSASVEPPLRSRPPTGLPPPNRSKPPSIAPLVPPLDFRSPAGRAVRPSSDGRAPTSVASMPPIAPLPPITPLPAPPRAAVSPAPAEPVDSGDERTETSSPLLAGDDAETLAREKVDPAELETGDSTSPSVGATSDDAVPTPNIPVSTAPASLPPPADQHAVAVGPSPACPQCEAPMAWVDEHLRFYCRACRMYF